MTGIPVNRVAQTESEKLIKDGRCTLKEVYSWTG